MADHTETDEKTHEVEREESGAAHQADRPPTKDEEAAADRSAKRSDDQKDVGEHYREMTELGANEKGEGRIA